MTLKSSLLRVHRLDTAGRRARFKHEKRKQEEKEPPCERAMRPRRIDKQCEDRAGLAVVAEIRAGAVEA
eukprot:752297-Hanusia_phi.AAC.2